MNQGQALLGLAFFGAFFTMVIFMAESSRVGVVDYAAPDATVCARLMSADSKLGL